MSDRCVYTLPIEITDDLKNLSCDGNPLVLTKQTCGDISRLLYVLDQACSGVTAGFVASINSDFKVVLTASGVFTITWTDTDLRDLLGFTGDLAGAATYTATYTPERCWFPSLIRTSREYWQYDHGKAWQGEEMIDGSTPGLLTGSEVWRYSVTYEHLRGYELLLGQTTTDYEATRCLEMFVLMSRTIWPADADHASPSGFYYYPDYTDCQPVSAMSAGGVQFNLAASPDTYVYCCFDSGWKPQASVSIPVGMTYAKVGLDFHTASLPSGISSW